MNKKIIISLSVIGLVAAIVVGGTIAYFSDTETSTGNTFTAGSIDLKIDNESYYNGEVQTGLGWELRDLTDELFFNFSDLKPGDWGEDTISLHVDNNDSWLCASITLTSNDENDITEPEEELGDSALEGELAQEIEFIWWADDGDNVLESDETVISNVKLGDAWLNQSHTIVLADSESNIWEGNTLPLKGGKDYYIGKAWCFGDLEWTLLSPDEYLTIQQNNFTCNGEPVSNISQSDSATLDVSFYAVQSRNNGQFTCSDYYGKIVFLRLENKDAQWQPILGDGMYGSLTFKSPYPTFDYSLDVYGLDPTSEYALHYYKNPWPSTGGKIINTFTTDANGDWTGSNNIELNMDLPVDNADTNWPSAKIWVVPTSDLDSDGSMNAWNQAALLFEWNLVNYDDTDI